MSFPYQYLCYRLFVRTLYNGAFPDQSLFLNRRRSEKEMKIVSRTHTLSLEKEGRERERGGQASVSKLITFS